MGKSLLVAATSPFQQYNTGATALVSLDVFALQVTAGRRSRVCVCVCVCVCAQSGGPPNASAVCCYMLLHSVAQASTNVLLCHLVGLTFANIMLRVVNVAIAKQQKAA